MTVSEKVYTFEFFDGEDGEIPNVRDIVFTIPGKNQGINILETFKENKIINKQKIRGYSILDEKEDIELFDVVNSRKVIFKKRNPLIQMNDKEIDENVDNPHVEMVDLQKEEQEEQQLEQDQEQEEEQQESQRVEQEEQKLEQGQEQEEEQQEGQREEQVEEQEEQEQENTEAEEPSKTQKQIKTDGNDITELTKVKQDFERFLTNGFRMYSEGNLRLFYKKEHEPILIVADEKEESYEFLEYVTSHDEKNHEFVNKKGENLIFEIAE